MGFLKSGHKCEAYYPCGRWFPDCCDEEFCEEHCESIWSYYCDNDWHYSAVFMYENMHIASYLSSYELAITSVDL